MITGELEADPQYNRDTIVSQDVDLAIEDDDDDDDIIDQEGASNTKSISLNDQAKTNSAHDVDSMDCFDEVTAATDFFKDL